MTTTASGFAPGDVVRLAIPPPSPTDPIGEVADVETTGERTQVVVRWSSGGERRYHPSALILARPEPA